MKINFYNNRIDIVTENIIGNIKFHPNIQSVFSLDDFPKNVLERLPEDKQEQVYWFFLDLENSK